MVDVVDFALAVAQLNQRLDDRKDVFLTQHAHGVGRIEFKAHVHLHATNRGEVITLFIEEQALEQTFGGFTRRRFAGAHDAVDFKQRLFVAFGLVGAQRVADIGAGVDVVDVEDVELRVTGANQRLQHLVGDFVTGFGVDFTRGRVHQFIRQIMAVKILVTYEEFLHAIFGQLLGQTRRDLLAGFHHDLFGLGVDEVHGGLHAAIAVGVKRCAPEAVLHLRVGHGVVVVVQDLFALKAQRVKKRGHGQLAAAVDAHEHDVLGVEFEIEP